MSEEKRKINIGAVVILIISAVVFIPFGGSAVFDAFFSASNTSFGKVNGEKIKYEPGSDFYNAVANTTNLYKENYKIDTSNPAYTKMIVRQAYFETLRSRVYSGAVERSGYEVPEAAVDASVVKYFSPEGTFLKAAYDQSSEGEIKNLRENYEKQLVFRRYADDLFGSADGLYGVKTSSKELDFIASFASEKHSFETAAFDTSVCPDEVSSSYLSDNGAKFIKYSLLAVTMDKKKDAQSVLDAVNAGELEFDTAVTEKSQKYYTDDSGVISGSYGYQIDGMFDDASSAEAVKALAADGISEVLPTKLGYTFFKCTGAPVEASEKNEDAVKTVKDYIKSNEASIIEKYYLGKADEFVSEASVHGFDAACRKFYIEKTEIPAFAVNYGSSNLIDSTASTAPLNSIGNDRELLEKVFGLKVKEVSTPFVSGSNVIVAICTGIQNDEADTVGLDKKAAGADESSAAFVISNDYYDNDAFEAAYAKVFVRD